MKTNDRSARGRYRGVHQKSVHGTQAEHIAERMTEEKNERMALARRKAPITLVKLKFMEKPDKC